MACKKCGGNRSSTTIEYPIFTVELTGENLSEPLVNIGAKSSMWLEGLAHDQVFLRVGNTLKVSNAAAADLKNKGAPIWIL